MPAVRRAEARDLDGVVALWSALMHHHAGFDSHYRVAQRAEEPWRKFLAGHLSRRDAAVFVCCEGGGPDGFSMVHLSRGPPVLPDRLRAEITDLNAKLSASPESSPSPQPAPGASWNPTGTWNSTVHGIRLYMVFDCT